MKRKNEDQLTDDEISVLRSDRTPEAIKQFVTRQHRDVGLRASAYRKVAAAAKAEREALMEIKALEVTRAAIGGPTSDPVARVAELETERDALIGAHEQMRTQLMQMTSLPAAAVHSDD